SSQESTGMIARGKLSRRVVIRLSKQEESLLRHSLGSSARLTVTFHDGRNGTRMNVTRTGYGKGGTPKSYSSLDSQWSHASRPYRGENGSSPVRSDHRTSSRMPTQSVSVIPVTSRTAYTGLSRSQTVDRDWS